jgi:hypothetical protein
MGHNVRELLLDDQAATDARRLACRLVQALGCMCISIKAYTAPSATASTAARRSHWTLGRIETADTSDSAKPATDEEIRGLALSLGCFGCR